MATTASIAALRKRSIERLTRAMDALAEQNSVAPVEIPRKVRNPDLLYAKTLEAFAAWAEKLAGIEPPSQPVDDADDDVGDTYEVMTEAILLNTVSERGIVLDADATRDDMLAALRAWDAANIPAGTDPHEAPPTPDVPTNALLERLNAMSKGDVVAEAKAAGMDTNSRTSKGEAVDFLLARNGSDETEQADAMTEADAFEGVNDGRRDAE